MTRVLVARVLPVVVAIALVAVTIVVAARPPGAAAGSNRLPDLDQVAPTNLVITRAGPRSRPSTDSDSSPP